MRRSRCQGPSPAARPRRGRGCRPPPATAGRWPPSPELRSDRGELFLRYLKEYLRELFSGYLKEFDPAIPEAFLLRHLTDSFAAAAHWWLTAENGYEPEEMAAFYMAVIGQKGA